MRKLTVKRKSYMVKGHYMKTRSGKKVYVKPHKVKSSRFKIKDRGRPGRGKKIIPKLKRGGLGGKGFFKKSKGQQEKIAFNVAKIKGERTAIGRLAVLQDFFKGTKPSYAARARELRRRVAGSFEGKKRVMYPAGFSRRGK